MKITPLKTNDISVVGASKTLVYGMHGSGKTTQCANYAKRFGKGLILSGESGLSSISDLDCDYLPFATFDRVTTKDGEHSFRDLTKFVMSADFKAAGYKWIAIDSATELSQKCFADVEHELGDAAKNGFEKWSLYERKITAALKWVRDLDMHVLITALAAEETDDNGQTNYWPMMVQKKVQKLIPALYDNVFCLVRKTSEQKGKVSVRRYLITDQVGGWHGKTRDPHRRLSAAEECDDVTDLIERIYMTKSEFAKYNGMGEIQNV
tara:strand:+ start:599 stop:1393 length:795 start_codon:yes stop_codon:yes gene_type:complete